MPAKNAQRHLICRERKRPDSAELAGQRELSPVNLFVEADDQIELAGRKLHEIAELALASRGSLEDEGTRTRGLCGPWSSMRSLTPAGGAEGMLAAQMVGTHSAALECLRRSCGNPRSDLSRGATWRSSIAQKLMALYSKATGHAGYKHRGKGQQKVTVEHVNVAAGRPGHRRHMSNTGQPPGRQPE